MLAAGMSHEAIVSAVADMEASLPVIDNRTMAAKRQARYRERVTERNETSRNVTSVTDVTPTPSLDKESFPQTPFKEINPIPVRDTRTRGARLPEGWKPKTCDRSTKAGQSIEHRGQQWAKDTLERFTNHWRAKAGRDACKVDWQATWANWVIEQDGRDGRNGRSNGKSASGYGVTVDAAIAFIADGELQRPDPGGSR